MRGSDGGRAAEQRALHLAGQERVEGALAGDGRACAGNREPDRARCPRSAPAGTGRRRRPQRSQEPRARAPRRSLRGRGARRESCRRAGSRSLRRDDRRAVDGRGAGSRTPSWWATSRAASRSSSTAARRSSRCSRRSSGSGSSPTHVLRTHGHPDHVEHEELLTERFGIPVATDSIVTGGLQIEAIPTPGALRRRRRLRRQRRALLLGRHALPRRRGRRARRTSSATR